MDKKRFLSPNGIKPCKYTNKQAKITISEEEKKQKFEEIFIYKNNTYNNNTMNINNNSDYYTDNSSDNNSDNSSYDSLNYSMENLRLTSLENEINYTHDCLISPFKNSNDNLENYETEESLTEEDNMDDDDEGKDDYLNYIMDKKKYY